MSTAASISGVFAKKKRRTLLADGGLGALVTAEAFQEEGSHRPPTASSQPSITSPSSVASRLLQKKHHRRDSSSLLSLSSLSGTNVRRSSSLRSHRSKTADSSTTTGGVQQYRQRAAGHSVGDLLLQKDHISPTLDPPGSTSPPSPPRHRSKLSFSTRPFSRSLRSTDTLPIFPNEIDEVPEVPPLMANDQSRKLSTMQAPSINLPLGQRPAFASQVSLVREVPPSSHGSEAVLLPAPTSGGQTPHAIFQQIQETAAKRMATIQYIRRLHEGDIYFFNTLHFSQAGLSSLPSMNSQKLGRRATSYFALGYSLPILLEMNTSSALEYLKLLVALLQEFETYQTLNGTDGSGSLSRGRMGAMFKSSMGLGKGAGKGRRASATTDTYNDPSMLGLPQPTSAGGGTGESMNHSSYEFTYLLTPHIPFDPDFGTAFSSLCDTMMDMYANLLNIIGGPDGCSIALAEAFSKADKLIRKILVSNVVKEFEDHTRAGAKAEVAGLSRLVLGGLM